jgi:hypothetical protein
MKNSIRTCDLPACNAVPQPTAPPPIPCACTCLEGQTKTGSQVVRASRWVRVPLPPPASKRPPHRPESEACCVWENITMKQPPVRLLTFKTIVSSKWQRNRSGFNRSCALGLTFIFALDGGEWSNTHSSRFTPVDKRVHSEQEAGWAPEPVWTFGGRDNSLARSRIRSPDHPGLA